MNHNKNTKYVRIKHKNNHKHTHKHNSILHQIGGDDSKCYEQELQNKNEINACIFGVLHDHNNIIKEYIEELHKCRDTFVDNMKVQNLDEKKRKFFGIVINNMGLLLNKLNPYITKVDELNNKIVELTQLQQDKINIQQFINNNYKGMTNDILGIYIKFLDTFLNELKKAGIPYFDSCINTMNSFHLIVRFKVTEQELNKYSTVLGLNPKNNIHYGDFKKKVAEIGKKLEEMKTYGESFLSVHSGVVGTPGVGTRTGIVGTVAMIPVATAIGYQEVGRVQEPRIGQYQDKQKSVSLRLGSKGKNISGDTYITTATASVSGEGEHIQEGIDVPIAQRPVSTQPIDKKKSRLSPRFRGSKDKNISGDAYITTASDSASASDFTKEKEPVTGEHIQEQIGVPTAQGPAVQPTDKKKSKFPRLGSKDKKKSKDAYITTASESGSVSVSKSKSVSDSTKGKKIKKGKKTSSSKSSQKEEHIQEQTEGAIATQPTDKTKKSRWSPRLGPKGKLPKEERKKTPILGQLEGEIVDGKKQKKKLFKSTKSKKPAPEKTSVSITTASESTTETGKSGSKSEKSEQKKQQKAKAKSEKLEKSEQKKQQKAEAKSEKDKKKSEKSGSKSEKSEQKNQQKAKAKSEKSEKSEQKKQQKAKAKSEKSDKSKQKKQQKADAKSTSSKSKKSKKSKKGGDSSSHSQSQQLFKNSPPEKTSVSITTASPSSESKEYNIPPVGKPNISGEL